MTVRHVKIEILVRIGVTWHTLKSVFIVTCWPYLPRGAGTGAGMEWLLDREALDTARKWAVMRTASWELFPKILAGSAKTNAYPPALVRKR